MLKKSQPCNPATSCQQTGYKKTAKLEDDARLDIRARSFWRNGQNAFFDVRITNADSASHQDSSLKTVLQGHEGEKKRGYNRRVLWKWNMAPLHH